MDEHQGRGGFSKSVVSLTWQLRTLFEGFGGIEAVKFLDRMGELSGMEQRAALGVFHGVLEKFAENGQRFTDSKDTERKGFEESLYNDLVQTLSGGGEKKGRLEVVPGGRKRRADASLSMGRQLRRAQSGGEIKQFPLRPKRA